MQTRAASYTWDYASDAGCIWNSPPTMDGHPWAVAYPDECLVLFAAFQSGMQIQGSHKDFTAQLRCRDERQEAPAGRDTVCGETADADIGSHRDRHAACVVTHVRRCAARTGRSRENHIPALRRCATLGVGNRRLTVEVRLLDANNRGV